MRGVNEVNQLPLSTIKFHQLQVLRNTTMAKEYEQYPENFSFFECNEYIDFFVKYLEQLNPAIVVERFASEVPPRYLLSPGWGMVRNTQLLQMLEKRLEELDTWQGRLYKPSLTDWQI